MERIFISRLLLSLGIEKPHLFQESVNNAEYKMTDNFSGYTNISEVSALSII